jgi:hypothetical protein
LKIQVYIVIICIMSNKAFSADNQQERLSELGFYLAGFVDGEGSFNVSLRKKSDYKLKWQVVLSFNVSQKDISILEILKDTLKCGIVKKRRCDGLYSYDATKPQDIIQKVIPFFDRFGFLSKNKKINYSIFKEICFLSCEKPMTLKNFEAILRLREQLNLGKGRKRKYSINDVLKESSETIRRVSLIT